MMSSPDSQAQKPTRFKFRTLTAKPETLTADFLPHSKGRCHERESTVAIGLPFEAVRRDCYMDNGDGTVTVLNLSLRPTNAPAGFRQPTLKPKTEFYKTEQGYVYMGTGEIGGTVDWQPVIKIGAKQGDTWDHEHEGIRTLYKLNVILNATGEALRASVGLGADGHLWTAAVEARSEIGGKRYKTLYTLGYNIGLMRKEMYEAVDDSSKIRLLDELKSVK